jgi:hypothetical protein
MWIDVSRGVAVAITIVTVLRIEHLVAADFWILRHGRDFVRDLKGRSPLTVRNPQRVWQIYKAHGGHTIFLFFGIKSYLLYSWASQTTTLWHRVRGAAARIVRFFWRFFVYPVILSVGIIAVAMLSHDSTINNFALATSLLLNLGSIAIAAEAVISAQRLESWANWYHRWPAKRPAHDQSKRRTEELAVFIGSVLIAFFSAAALIIVAGARFGAFQDFPEATHGLDLPYVLTSVGYGFRSALFTFTTFTLNPPASALGYWVISLVAVVEVCYLVLGITVVGKLWQ